MEAGRACITSLSSKARQKNSWLEQSDKSQVDQEYTMASYINIMDEMETFMTLIYYVCVYHRKLCKYTCID